MIIYRCPTCDNAQLDFDKAKGEDKYHSGPSSKYALIGSLNRESYKSVKNKRPSFAYCEHCHCNWDFHQLKEEKVTSAGMLKFTIALMMLSVMLFLSGLLLLVLSLLAGAIVLVSSLLLFFITTVLYKRY